jgi:hypothetical protein
MKLPGGPPVKVYYDDGITLVTSDPTLNTLYTKPVKVRQSYGAEQGPAQWSTERRGFVRLANPQPSPPPSLISRHSSPDTNSLPSPRPMHSKPPSRRRTRRHGISRARSFGPAPWWMRPNRPPALPNGPTPLG